MIFRIYSTVTSKILSLYCRAQCLMYIHVHQSHPHSHNDSLPKMHKWDDLWLLHDALNYHQQFQNIYSVSLIYWCITFDACTNLGAWSSTLVPWVTCSAWKTFRGSSSNTSAKWRIPRLTKQVLHQFMDVSFILIADSSTYST